MSEPSVPPGAPTNPRDRAAYLEEQIARQKRGEPVDVEWVRAELERVRTEQIRRINRTKKQLLVLTLLSGAALLAVWIKGGGLNQPGGPVFLAVMVFGAVATWIVARRRKKP